MMERDAECEAVRFQTGTEVRVVRDVRNDGSFYQLEKGDLLVQAGAIGEVRSYGYFLQTQVIYQVFFPSVNRIIGVRDAELIDAKLAWIPVKFRSQDKAKLNLALKMGNDIIANKGDVVEIYRVHRDLDDGSVKYEIELADYYFKLDSTVFSAV